jgi:hypothetical protein
MKLVGAALVAFVVYNLLVLGALGSGPQAKACEYASEAGDHAAGEEYGGWMKIGVIVICGFRD